VADPAGDRAPHLSRLSISPRPVAGRNKSVIKYLQAFLAFSDAVLVVVYSNQAKVIVIDFTM
jgi:hypothetical protein